MPADITLCAGAALAAYALYRAARTLHAQLTSPLRHFPGPPSTSFVSGNFSEIHAADNSTMHEKWVREYGHTYRYKGYFGTDRLFTMDTKALNHVLMTSEIYHKPAETRYHLGRVLGEGILITEDEQHKMQRKIMNPAFGPAQIRELTPIFVEKAIQLRDIWAAESADKGGTARIDVLSWLSRMTLDVIGLAGFNYKFDALNPEGKPNELNRAFSTMFNSARGRDILQALKGFFPIFRIIPSSRDAQITQAQKTMARIGNGLLRDSKAAARAEGGDKHRPARDLLSLLVAANMAEDLPEEQRLSDKDVLAQVPTFLVAGHETTSSAVTWALFALTQNRAVQEKLRAELLAVPTDAPTMDALSALQYLDYVVRETLRVHAPVPSSIRVATRDDVIPLNTPFVDRRGVSHDSISVSKGHTIFIPILGLNRSKDIWGEDVLEFRPERWEKVPDAATAIPGVWSNMLSFLGGPRSCIGYRFSLIEIKALLFTLVRAFEFKLAVPLEDLGKRSTIVQRPFLRSDPGSGNQLPLLVTPYVGA